MVTLNQGVETTKLQVGQVVNVPCSPQMDPPAEPGEETCTNGCNVYCSKFNQIETKQDMQCSEIAVLVSLTSAKLLAYNPTLTCAGNKNANASVELKPIEMICTDGMFKPALSDLLDLKNPLR